MTFSACTPIAAKLLTDVCGFLVTVAALNPEFRTFARTAFVPPEPVGKSDPGLKEQRGGQVSPEDPAVEVGAIPPQSGADLESQPRLPIDSEWEAGAQGS
jgi:hypothetical protein